MFNAFVDFGYLKKRLIPYFLRQPKLLAYFKSICKPLIDINDSFKSTVEDIEYCLTITGQKIYLEKLLNDCFDEYLRRIRIRNNNPNKFLYVYNNSEFKPPIFVTNNGEPLAQTYDFNTNTFVDAEVYLLNEAETTTLYDYTVVYPATLTISEGEFRSKINKYNPSGRIYNFETV